VWQAPHPLTCWPTMAAGSERWLSQALVEYVRELDLGRYGYQQMQVDAEYLRQHMWRFVAQERSA